MIWLEAGSEETLERGLKAAALALQDECMEPRAGNRPRTAHQDQHNHGGAFFYKSDQPYHSLQKMLSAWLKNGRFDDSKVLVILDDVDGLSTSELSHLSNLISSDQVEVIYTTRDPMIADPSSHMPAYNFEVAPLQPATADGLLQRIRNPSSPGITHQRDDSIGLSKEEIGFTSKITASLGHLPGAIINASHFLIDNFCSTSPDAMQKYLRRWESDDTRHEILEYRRRTTRYPNTILESYDISVGRLKRNTETGGKDLFLCSLTMLRLLCLMNVVSFAQDQIDELKTPLLEFVTSRSEKSEVRSALEQISQDTIPVFRYITELVQVSLLSFSDRTRAIVINDLIKACVQLCRRGCDDRASLMSKTEAAYLKQAADYILVYWAPASRKEASQALPVAS